MGKCTMRYFDGLIICDPCYCVDEKFYYDVWDKKHNFSEGLINDELGRYAMIVSHTNCGDGTFHDNLGNAYPVDSGNIAVINAGVLKPIPSYTEDEEIYDTWDFHLSGSGEVTVERTEDKMIVTISANNGEKYNIVINMD